MFLMAKFLQVGDIAAEGFPWQREVTAINVTEPDYDDVEDYGYQAAAITWRDIKGNEHTEYYDGNKNLTIKARPLGPRWVI